MTVEEEIAGLRAIRRVTDIALLVSVACCLVAIAGLAVQVGVLRYRYGQADACGQVGGRYNSGECVIVGDQ